MRAEQRAREERLGKEVDPFILVLPESKESNGSTGLPT